jgi:GNAT superfamily N-acetyltransferase
MPAPDSVQRYRAAFAQRDLVSEVEMLRARAWPPLTILDLDGWQLRSSRGLTRRANSAWPRAAGGRLSLEARLDQCEAFYLQGTTDPAVQLLPGAQPRGLEAALLGRGYRPTAPIDVRTARLDALAELAPADAVVTAQAQPWLARWAHASGAGSSHLRMAERMLERVPPPQAFAVVEDGMQLAVARGVLDGGWLGVDLLAASPHLRNAAVGHVLLATLARWAEQHGGLRAHVEVAPDDPTAIALTARARLRRAYAHRFLVRPRALARR